jgi:hypothetical protein
MPILLLIFITAISFLATENLTEKKYFAKNVSLSIKGTSTLHDWEMKSNEGKVEAIFISGSNNKLGSLSGLSFSLPAKSLKSGHNLMDNNTYKALKAEAHPQITFTLSSSVITQSEGVNFQLKCTGKLTIAGTTRDTELLANGKLNPADNSLAISGTKKMKMTEFNVKPPTVMMGTVKTGDEITINYNLKLIP